MKNKVVMVALVCGIAGMLWKSNENRLHNKNSNEKDCLIVAFIDSVCSIQNNDYFSSFIWKNNDEIAGNLIDDDGNGYVDDVNGWNYVKRVGNVFTEEKKHHCDFVVETFLDTLNKHGEKNNCEIMLLNVIGSDGECSTENIISAINYAEAKGAHICNLSLSTYQNDDKLLEVIEKNKMLFIVAAGNESENLDDGFPSYPTKYKLENLISVAAVNQKGELLEMSNYGRKTVDIAIEGTFRHGDVDVAGTSISTAKITSVAVIEYNRLGEPSEAKKLKKAIFSLAQKSSESRKIVSQGIINDR